MKINFLKSVTTKLGSKLLFAALLSTAAFNSKAQSSDNAVLTDSNVSVVYTGADESSISLLLKFENVQKAEYRISLYDNLKNELHREFYDGISFSKSFKVPADSGPLTFIVKNLKTKKQTTFQTTSIVRSYTDVAIKRINER